VGAWECARLRLAACAAVIVAGLAALGSLVVETWVDHIAMAAALLGAALGFKAAAGLSRRLALATAALAVAAFALASVAWNLLVAVAALVLAYAASLLAAGGGRVSHALALVMVAAPAASAFEGASYQAVAAASMLVSSLVVFEETRRGHAFTISALSPLALALSPGVAMAAGASALAVAAYSSGLTTRGGCPFRRDYAMSLAGTMIVLVSVPLWEVGAGVAGGWHHALWLTGFLFLLASALVPLGSGGSRPSSGA